MRQQVQTRRLRVEQLEDRRVLTMLNVPSMTLGEIEADETVDDYTFEVAAGEVYEVSATIIVDLLNEDPFSRVGLNLISGNDVVSAVSLQATPIRTATALWTAEQDASIFLTVETFPEPTQFQPRSYALDIRLASETADDDHGDVAEEATAVAVSSVTLGEVDSLADRDVFSVQPESGSLYRATLETSRETPFQSFRLFDDTGETIFDRSCGGGRFTSCEPAEFNWVSPDSRTYFIEVAGNVGPYALELISIAYGDDHGNTAETASDITVPSLNTGRFDVAGDVDVFAIEVEENVSYQVSTLAVNDFEALSGLPGGLSSSEAAAAIRVFDVEGNVIATEVASAFRSDRVLHQNFAFFTAEATGTVFIQTGIKHLGALIQRTAGDYSLLVDILPADDHGDSLETATAIECCGLQRGTIHVVRDVDWFSFSATAGTRYVFSSEDNSAIDFTLFDELGTEIATAERSRLFSREVDLVWIAENDGIHFVRVNARDNSVGEYIFDFVIPEDSEGASPIDATPLASGVAFAGASDFLDDEDVFSFDAEQDQQLLLTYEAAGGAIITVLGQDGATELASFDGFSRSFQLRAYLFQWVAPDDGTYFFRLEGQWPDPFDYSLTVDSPVDREGWSIPSAAPLAIGQTEGVRDFIGDREYFELSVVADTIYRVSVDNDEQIASGIVLLDSDGNQILSRGGVVAWRAEEDATNFLVISSLASEYTVNVEIIPFDDQVGGRAEAIPISVPGEVEVQSHYIGDEDYFSFNAQHGQELRFTSDLSFQIVDSFGGVQSLSSSSFFSPFRDWVAPASGEYFAKFEGDGVDTSTFRIEWLEACDTVGEAGCDIRDLDALQRASLVATTTADEFDAAIGLWLVEASLASNIAKRRVTDQYVQGDVDLDGDVDSTDLGLLLNNFGAVPQSTADIPLWSRGNFTADLDVDSVDLGILLNNFGFRSPDPVEALAIDFVFEDDEE